MRRSILGTIYIIHFDRPYKGTLHYVGWTEGSVLDRLERHRSGRGSPLLKAVNDAGIKYKVSRSIHNVTRNAERQIKDERNHKRYCPCCTNKPKKVKLI